LALHEEFDLIILDLILPGRSGFIIAKQIRGYGRETPILVISSRREISDIVAGFECGADGYLCKPFSLLELKTRVIAMLRRPPCTKRIKYQLGDISVDTNTSMVSKGQTELSLPNKQFQILKYLCAHPDRVVSKQELLDALWDANSDTLLNTLDVHISKLRRLLAVKLKVEKELICTFHGKGYRVNA
jgi:DNA-binding response OmpR family regulator